MPFRVFATSATALIAAFVFSGPAVFGVDAAPPVDWAPAEAAVAPGFDPGRDMILLQPAPPLGETVAGPKGAIAAETSLQAPDARACIGNSCIFASLASAFAEVIDNETITILPGIHREAVVLQANGVTIRGEPGAHLTGVAAEGKAAMVIRGANTTIENIECSGITVSDRNGACVRLEAPNLTLRRVHFHDNENGILTGENSGTVLIEDSIIENNGEGGGGYAHNVYVGGGTLIVRNSRIVRPLDEGHSIKSRAARTIVENSTVGSLDGVDSRTLDIPNGGEIIIRNNVLHQGPNTSNSNVIGIGLEIPDGTPTYEVNSTLVENNIIISDRERHTLYFQVKHVPEPIVRNNIFVGATKYPESGRDDPASGNVWHKSRKAAGLPPYPELPKPRS